MFTEAVQPPNTRWPVLAFAVERMFRERAAGKDPDVASYEERCGEDGVQLHAYWPPRDGTRSRASSAPVRVGHYEIVEEIGRGGQGVVYRARDPLLQADLALKVLHRMRGVSADALLRFRREGRAVAKLDHPAICPVLAAGYDDGQQYLAMRFIEGGSLRELLAMRREVGLPPERSHVRRMLEILRGVADGLHHAHSRGVLHRDVTPNNILIDDQDAPYLVDFGLARDEQDGSDLTRTADRFGTFGYMSPERLAMPPAPASVRSEVYAVGAVLCEAVTLERPTVGAGTVDGKPVLTLEGLSQAERRDLFAIIERATAHDPNDRYPSCKALADDIGALLSHASVSARAPGPALRLRRWCKRNPVVAALTAAVFVALGAGLIVSLTMLGRATDARNVADRALVDEAFRRYQAGIVAAQLSIRDGDHRVAFDLLEACPPNLRDWEWRHLRLLLDNSVASWNVGTAVGGLTNAETPPRVVTTAGQIQFRAHASGYCLARIDREQVQLVRVSPSGREERTVAKAALGDAKPLCAAYDPSTDAWFVLGGDHVLYHVAAGRPPRVLARFRSSWRPQTAALDVAPGRSLIACAVHQEDRFSSAVFLYGTDDLVERHRILIEEHAIDQLAFTADGLRLIVAKRHSDGGVGGILELYDATSGELLARTPMRSGRAHAVVAAADTGRIYVGCDDGAIRIFDGGLQSTYPTLRGHGGPVTCLRLPAKGALLSGSTDGTVRAWLRQGGGGAVSIRVPRAPDSKSLAFDDTGTLWVGTDGRELTGWDLRGGDGRRAMLAGPHRQVRFVDGALYWFDRSTWSRLNPDTGEIVRRRMGAPRGRLPRTQARCYVQPGNGVIEEYDWNAAQPMRRLEGADGTLEDLATSRDGGVVACTTDEGAVVLWRGSSHAPAMRWEGKRWGDVSISQDGRWVAFVEAGGVRIVDLRNGNASHQLPVEGRVSALAFNPSGSRLAIGAEDRQRGALSLWDPVRRQRLLVLDDVASVPVPLAWSPDGATLAAGGWAGAIRVWETLGRGASTGAGGSRPLHYAVDLPAQGAARIGASLALAREMQSPLLRPRDTIWSIVQSPLAPPTWYAWAREAANFTLRIAPENRRARIWRCASLLQLGRTSEARTALDALRTAIEADGGSASSFGLHTVLSAMAAAGEGDWSAVGRLLGAGGPAPDAGSDWKALVALHRDMSQHSDARRALALLRQGIARHGTPREAIADAKDASVPVRRVMKRLATGCAASSEAYETMAWLASITRGLPEEVYRRAVLWAEHENLRERSRLSAVARAILAWRTNEPGSLDRLRAVEARERLQRGTANPAAAAYLAIACAQAGRHREANSAYNRFTTLASQDRFLHDALTNGIRIEVRAAMAKTRR